MLSTDCHMGEGQVVRMSLHKVLFIHNHNLFG